MAEPNHDHPGGGTDADPDRVSEGVAALSELAAAGVEVRPDGALWFTEFVGQAIGRITTAGTISKFSDATVATAVLITAGPDGAVWFTNKGNSIGRIAVPPVRTTPDQCRNGGWQSLVDPNGEPFRNQGSCIAFVQHPA
jgi:hypothetical protein